VAGPNPSPDRPVLAFGTSVTPFLSTGEVDWESYRAQLRRFVDAGLGIYVAGSGSGEANTLSDDEVTQLIAVAVDEVSGRTPLRAMGREPRTSEDMTHFLEQAAGAGVEAAQIYPLDMGHGKRPSMRELLKFYETVIPSTDLPVILSTHRAVGYFLPIELMMDLLERYDNVVGINCTNPDPYYLSDLLASAPPTLEIAVGGITQAVSALALGASGFISSEANLAPHLASSVVEHFCSGSNPLLTQQFGRLLRLSGIIERGGGISATKALMNTFGFPGGFPRPPREPLADSECQRMAVEIRTLGIDELQS
jgi:4-hydroxy-tetrahydrodipicolinate synthase